MVTTPMLRRVAAVSLLVGLAAGYALGRRGGARGAPPKGERNQEGFSYIHPLLDCAPADGSFKDILPVKGDIESFIAAAKKSGKAAQLSVYYRDLDLGPWFGYDPEARFAPASLLKIPLLMAYLKIAEGDPGLLARRVRHEEKAIGYPQLFEPSKKLVAGKEYSIEEYLEAMIVRSDNQAAFFLLTHLDPAMLQNAYAGLGLKAPNKDTPTDWITVHEYASFYRVLYNSTYLSRHMSEKALAMLARTEFKGGLAAGVPAGTLVAHKFGERLETDNELKQLHDCGIVYHPKNPYLLCIMSRGRDVPTMLGVIRDLSAVVWEDVTQQAR